MKRKNKDLKIIIRKYINVVYRIYIKSCPENGNGDDFQYIPVWFDLFGIHFYEELRGDYISYSLFGVKYILMCQSSYVFSPRKYHWLTYSIG